MSAKISLYLPIHIVFFIIWTINFCRDFSHSASVGQTPTNILLLTIINAIHPVNIETVKKITEQHAEVQRIVIFHKNGLQALVEFLSIDDAQNVQQALNGCDIFASCCTLKIDFSKVCKNVLIHFFLGIQLLFVTLEIANRP